MKSVRTSKIGKRILAIVLVLAICSTMLPVNAYAIAAENHSEETQNLSEQNAETVLDEEKDTGPAEKVTEVSEGTADTGTAEAEETADEVVTPEDSGTEAEVVEEETPNVQEEPSPIEEITPAESEEPAEEVQPLAAGAPIEVWENNNYIELDPTNDVLKTPGDFAIGKMGEYQFAVRFAFTPNEIPDEQRHDVAVEFTIPVNFTLENMPTISGVTYTKRANADGSTTVIAKCNDGIVTSAVGQFYVRQNAEKLITDLPNSGGTYNFDMKMYAHYGKDNQTDVVTTGNDKIGRLTLQGDTTTPSFTIKNISDDYTWMPGELTTSSRNQSGIGDKDASAADNAVNVMQRDASQAGKGFKVEYHKTEGLLADNTLFDLILPDEGNLFVSRGLLYVAFTTDAGVTKVIKSYDWNTAAGQGEHDSQYVFQGAASAGHVSGNNYTEAAAGSGLSYADLYSEAGTFTLNYYPRVYYNRLYKGDWNNTTYTADAGSTVSCKDLATGNSETTTGDPLKFTFIQGDLPITFSNSKDVSIAHGADLVKMAQYNNTSPDYNDSQVLDSWAFFNTGKNFQIQDHLQLSYDYEEALSPIWLGSLRTAATYGFTYRIYITDATTGKVVRIETLVDEESFTNGYMSQTIDGVIETVQDGTSMTEWTLAEANTAGNTNYVSRIEMVKEQYEYNLLSFDGPWSDRQWFTYKLRAYHARLSDGTDIPDKYEATIHREMNSDQIEKQNSGAFEKDYKVTTTHLKDSLELLGSRGDHDSMEVNNHAEVGKYFQYIIKKNADTMDYNVDEQGNTIAYGETGYDPVVVEISGDAVTLVDRSPLTNGRLLGVWGDDGKYYDFQKMNFEPGDYTVIGQTTYSDTKESVTNSPAHILWGQGISATEFYDLSAVYKALGITYAAKLVLSVEDVNTLVVSNDSLSSYRGLFIKKVEPGYLNYDSVVGTGGSADLPKSLTYDAALYCQYSDYQSEIVDGNTASDSNGGTVHGTGKGVKNVGAAKLVEGKGATGISVYDKDYYINPYARTSDKRGNKIGTNDEVDQSRLIGNTLSAAADNGLELTQVKVNGSQEDYWAGENVSLQYQNAAIDFAGTDKDLLSLTNSISFTLGGWTQYWDFGLEYTLSNGETKSYNTAAIQAWSDYQSGRMYYIIPEVDIANGIYLTSLKVTFPNGLNWGYNEGKLVPGVIINRSFPSIGLGMVGVNIPSVYPASGDAVGTTYTDEKDDKNYDKLDVKASLTYENIYGEVKTNTADFTAEGKSNRIMGQQVKIAKLVSDVTYGKASTNQGDQVQVNTREQFSASGSTHKMLTSNGVLVRPTYYYKVAKDFAYVEGSISGAPAGAIANFIPAGTGEGKSGDADYGYVVVSFDGVADENLVKASGTASWIQGNEGWIPYYQYNINFKLQVSYDAQTITQTPVAAVMMDTPYDANRDGKGAGNATGIIVETCNEYNQLVDNGPYGDAFGNTTTAKNSNKDKSAEMLYTEIKTTHKILEQTIQGVVPYAIATHPYQESSTSVTSKDMTGVENLYSERVYMTGDEKSDTNDWEVYIPITKQGETYSYVYGGQTLTTDANAFTMDLLSVDTSDMDAKTLDYVVWYTTDSNPGTNGYTGAKGANWVKWRDKNGVTSAPADLGAVTMIKVTVESIQTKEKVNFQLNYKLHEHKSQVGTQTNNAVFYANFSKEGRGGALYFGDVGQTSLPMQYILTDMNLTGYIWDEEDYNSTYNVGEKLLSGTRLKLLDKVSGEEVVQTGNNSNVTNQNGKYSLIMPHDGDWDVEIVLPKDKKLVGKMVNGDEAIDSAFDRDSNIASISFEADWLSNSYTKTNVNGGIYFAPQMTFTPEGASLHVGEMQAGKIAAAVENRVGSSLVRFKLKPGEDTSIATVYDQGDETAVFDGLKTGAVKALAFIDDGYGGIMQKEFDIIVYQYMKYDVTNRVTSSEISKTTGSAPVDTKQYYPSVDSDGNDAETDKVTAAQAMGFASAGYTFKGWAASETDAEDGNVLYEADDVFRSGASTTDSTLYAVWEANTDTRYVIEHYQQDLGNDNFSKVGTEEKEGTTDEAASYSEQTYAGFTYDAARTTFASTGSTVSADSLTVAGDGSLVIRLYYTRNIYDVKFDKGNTRPNGITADIAALTGGDDQTVAYRGQAATGAAVDMVNKEYGFAGWSYDYTAADGTRQTGTVLDYTTLPILGDVTFTATYAHKPFVVANAAGGYVNVAATEEAVGTDTSVAYEIPEGETLPTTAVITYAAQDGYALKSIDVEDLYGNSTTLDLEQTGEQEVFHGSGAGATAKLTLDDNGQKISISGIEYSLIVNVNFVRQYEVKFFEEDGTQIGNTQKIFDGEMAKVEIPKEKEGYSFSGWTPDGGVTKMTKEEIEAAGVVGDTDYRATYTANTYKIIFDKNAENATGTMAEQNMIYDTESALYANAFTRGGYTFKGWTEKADGTVLYEDRANVKNLAVSGEVTLYAVWEQYAPVTENKTVTKILAGQEPAAASDFTFLLTAKSEHAPMPEGSVDGVQKVTITGAGAAEFGMMKFTEAGTYDYEITEADEGLKGYTYSDQVYTLTVEITDNGTEYVKKTTLVDKNGNTVTEIRFTNTYVPEAVDSIAPEVTKTIEGADRPEEQTFTFTMKPEGEAPAPENTTATVMGEGTASAFGKITFIKAGTYIYDIAEIQGTANGYTYDTTVYQYEVIVTDENGTLVAEEHIYKGRGDNAEAAEGITFTNSYAAASGTYTVPTVTKAIDGETSEDKTFTFTITGKEGTEPMPVTEARATTGITITGAGLGSFGDITFEKAGTYVYEVKETAGSENGYTYDDSIYTITVVVKDNDGQLEAEGRVTKGEEAADAILFTNKYETKPVTVDPPVEKKITGDTPSADETFTFQMKAADSAFPMPEGSENGVKLAIVKGAGKVEFGEYTYTRPGTYSYSISEVAGSNTEYAYDKTVYTLTDVVTDVDGTLTVERAITDGDGQSAERAVFTNVYTKPAVAGPTTPTKPGTTITTTGGKTNIVSKMINNVKTGDPASITFLVILLLAAGGVIIVTLRRRKVKK